jgi:diaminopimelate decarboxylase
MVEPGRSLVGNTGLLLTTVLGIKETLSTKERGLATIGLND